MTQKDLEQSSLAQATVSESDKNLWITVKTNGFAGEFCLSDKDFIELLEWVGKRTRKPNPFIPKKD
jgi:hypothetical protein